MEIILNTSYDLNTRDDKGRTALHSAYDNGRTEIIQFLITASKDFTINLNARDGLGCTILHLACRDGKTETAQLIIQNSKIFDIDLNAKDDEGDTALHWACICQGAILSRIFRLFSN